MPSHDTTLPVAKDDQFLIAHLHGQRPAAPAWFDRAVAQVPVRSTLPFESASLEVLTWGEVGKPGLLMLHGGMAHADWWSFIAPFFAATHRVVAFSWSGMGGSTWRETYATDQYVRELLEVCAATGLFAGPAKPAILAHSFGGFPTMATAAQHGDRFSGVIILDAPVETPAQVAARVAKRKAEKPPKPKRIHMTEASALARFRFSPPQPCENLYIVDWIARHSLRRARDPETGAEGFTWKFDPYLWSRLQRRDGLADLKAAKTRVAMVWGATSPLFPPETVAFCRETAPAGSIFAEIPEAAHHVMADQPLALVATTQAILSAWNG